MSVSNEWILNLIIAIALMSIMIIKYIIIDCNE